jgi:hypothetical protein
MLRIAQMLSARSSKTTLASLGFKAAVYQRGF